MPAKSKKVTSQTSKRGSNSKNSAKKSMQARAQCKTCTGSAVVSSAAPGSRYMSKPSRAIQFGSGRKPYAPEDEVGLKRRYQKLGEHLPFLRTLARCGERKSKLLLAKANVDVLRLIKYMSDDLFRLKIVPKNLKKLREKIECYRDLMTGLFEEKNVKKIRHLQHGGFLSLLLRAALPLVRKKVHYK